MAVMTLEEAAKILGVAPNADKATVNASYRKLVAKYHPDANRNKSPQEQKQAEVMFKKVAQARKILLDPSKVASPTPQHQSQAQQYRSQQPRRTQQPQRPQQQKTQPSQGSQQYQQAQANAYRQTQAQAPRTTRTHYNNAKTFQDNIPHEVDLPERQLKSVYKKDVRANYHKAQDIFRISPSMIISILVLLYSALMIVSNESELVAINFDNIYVLIFCAGIVKFIIYDLLISYYVMKPVKEIGFGWLMTAGIEAILVALVLFIFAMFNSVVDPIFLALLPLGIIFISVSIAKRTDKKKN